MYDKIHYKLKKKKKSHALDIEMGEIFSTKTGDPEAIKF